MSPDTLSGPTRTQRPLLPTWDDVALVAAYAIPGSVLGPAVAANVFAWSTGTLPLKPTFWLGAVAVGLACGLTAIWLRRSRNGAVNALLVACGVPAAFALCVVLVWVVRSAAELGLLTMLVWGWIPVLFDVVRSLYHSLPLALVLGLVALCDGLVGGLPATSAQHGLRRRRALLLSLTLTAAWIEYREAPAWVDGPSADALLVALAGMATACLSLDVLAWRRVAATSSIGDPNRSVSVRLALVSDLLAALAFALFLSK